MTVFQKSSFSPSTEKTSLGRTEVKQSSEKYLNHPTFGLLYRVCLLEDNLELFTTIYANRLFFSVTTSAASIKFETISRTNACTMVEKRLRQLRSTGQSKEYQELMPIYKQTFQ